jgi:hypothetical protein
VSSLGYDPADIEGSPTRESHNLRFSKTELLKRASESANPPHLAMLSTLKKLKDSGSFTTFSELKSKPKPGQEAALSSPMVKSVKQGSDLADRLSKTGRGSQDNIKSSFKAEGDKSDSAHLLAKRKNERVASCLGTPNKSQKGSQTHHERDNAHLHAKTLYTTVKIKDIVSKR